MTHFLLAWLIYISEFGFKDKEEWNGTFRDIYTKGTVLFIADQKRRIFEIHIGA